MNSEDPAEFTLLENQHIEKSTWRSYREKNASCTASIIRLLSYRIHLTALYMIIALLLVALLLCGRDPSQKLYSPAAGAIKYKTELWPDNLSYKSPYMADGPDGMPTDETDRLWSELYELGITYVPSSQAAYLPNETAALPDGSDRYPIQLGVFHQLHCLNNLRMAFYPDRYAETYHDLLPTDGSGSRYNYSSHDAHHIGHCIDSLRLVVMCHSDVTPLTWVYDEAKRVPLPTLQVQHTCRNFDAIQQWAEERAIVDEAELEWPHGQKADFTFRGKAAE